MLENQKELMVISCPFKLINKFVPISFTGHHCVQDPAITEEPNSPSTLTPHKHKVFSTTDSSAIRYIALFNLECISGEVTAKYQKTGPTHSQLDAVVIPWATRKLTHASKSTSNFKKDVGDLFHRLGQEFKMVTKTFKKIAEIME